MSSGDPSGGQSTDDWLRDLGVSHDSFAAGHSSSSSASHTSSSGGGYGGGSGSSGDAGSTSSKASQTSHDSQASSGSYASHSSHGSSATSTDSCSSATSRAASDSSCSATSTASTSSCSHPSASSQHSSCSASSRYSSSTSSQSSDHSCSSTCSSSSAVSSSSSHASSSSGKPADTQYAQGIADRLVQKLKAGGDLRFDMAMLAKMDMKTLLVVMDDLKKAGKLQDFAGNVSNERIEAAIRTVLPDYGARWEGLVNKLNDEDRNAILARVPPDVKKRLGKGGPRPPDGPPEPDGPGKGVIVVGPDGAEVQAKLTFKSESTGNLGETEFTVHISPDGKISQFEVDITAIKSKLMRRSALGPILDLEATLSLNSTVNLGRDGTKIIFDRVDAQLKGEIEIHFKGIPALRKVAFKLTATAGSAGFGFTATAEIPIPLP